MKLVHRDAPDCLCKGFSVTGVAQEGDQLRPVFDVTPYDLQELKQLRKQQATQRRWEVETGGIQLPNGLRVKTAIEDQNRVTSVLANAKLLGLETISFKAENGWAQISVEQLKYVVKMMGAHIQACFSAERQHHTAIDALDDVQALQQYDITQHFPPSVH